MTIGIDLEYYWNKINPKQFLKHIRNYEETMKNNAIQTDAMNWNLAWYIAVGINDPKKFPSKPHLSIKKDAVMTDEEMENVIRNISKKQEKYD